ncbi:MAG TPA: hypothetical protein ENH43_01990 [Phycisphaerales bacterium]|nr:hypothetical protein [Phycisphaerales bacterium]
MKARTKLFLVAVLGLWALCGSAGAIEGSGTEAEPYIITNVDELQAMQNDLDAWYELGNDIDASDTQNWNAGAGFEPVGDSTAHFTGAFDGQGHTVTGLYINRPSSAGIGLFGYVHSGAEIKNVGLVDVNIYGNYHTGSLAGGSYGSSTISNCYATGQVTISASGSSDAKSGGLVGSNGNSTISQCYSAVNVTALSSRYQLGGLCGYSRARSGDPPALIINCYATGTVTSNGWKVGGLLGDADGRNSTVSKCYSAGRVNGTHKKGLVGYNYRSPAIKDSYWDTQTSTCSSSYGGTGKPTAEMMRQATFANWDFANTWYVVEDETYPFLRWELSGYERAVINIEDAIAEKHEALERIDAALEKEQAASDALDELLGSGDYGDLSRRDVFIARRKIRFAIRLEKWSKKALEISIKKLEEALDALGWEPEPLSEPIAYWKFDEGQGDTAYDSAGDNDGTVYGAQWTTGQVNGALSFDGEEDYVDCGNPSELNPEYVTIEAWIKTSSTGSTDSIVGKDKSSWPQQRVWGFRKRGDNEKLEFIVFKTDSDFAGIDDWDFATGITNISDGIWHHVAGTWDGSIIKIYVDGQEDGSKGYVGSLQQGQTNNVFIGKMETFDPSYFNGLIDDVRIYDRALSADQIQQLYEDGLSGPGKGKKK